jgi:drug/metabolite transporter (DMT)-like permease
VVFNGTVVLKLNPVGDILSFGAAMCWAIYSVILKKQVDRYDSVYLTRKVLFYSILTTLPMLFIEAEHFPLREAINPSYLFHLLFLGALGSGLCYVAWNLAAKKLGIVITNNYIYLNPFVTMTVAGLMLHETVTVMGVAGAGLIISGVVVAGKKAV